MCFLRGGGDQADATRLTIVGYPGLPGVPVSHRGPCRWEGAAGESGEETLDSKGRRDAAMSRGTQVASRGWRGQRMFSGVSGGQGPAGTLGLVAP